MNKIIVIGNLYRDPEMRYALNGQGVTCFRESSGKSAGRRDCLIRREVRA